MFNSGSLMKSAFVLLFATVISLEFTSCKQEPVGISFSKWLEKVDIYMGGELGDSSTYWKNGAAIGVSKKMSANGVTLSGKDSYLAGFIVEKDSLTNNGTARAAYCKNGNIVYLTDGKTAANATAIAVSGADVYVAGYEFNGDKNPGEPNHTQKSIAKFWKNGVPVPLTDGHANAQATAIALKGGDVYVAGYEKDQVSVARYWKNGKQIALRIDSNLSSGANYSEAYAIFLEGNDVYIAGTECGLAAYWKNGLPVLLGAHKGLKQSVLDDDLESSKATSIAVSGTDVHVAGIQDTMASQFHIVKYWKNGKSISLSKPPLDAKTNAFLAINGTDCYITCTLADAAFNYQTMVWKNTIPALVSKGTMRVTSIFVKNKSR